MLVNNDRTRRQRRGGGPGSHVEIDIEDGLARRCLLPRARSSARPSFVGEKTSAHPPSRRAFARRSHLAAALVVSYSPISSR
jgi:hypothetical protein